MKTAKAFLAGLLFIGLMTASNRATAEEGIVSKDKLDQSSYCHMKFAPITPGTMASERPVLGAANPGALIDYYGPCDEDPLGKDQIRQQKWQEQQHLPASAG